MIEVRRNFVSQTCGQEPLRSICLSREFLFNTLLFFLVSFAPFHLQAADSLTAPLSPFVAHIPLEMMILPGTAHFLEEAMMSSLSLVS